MDKLKVYIITIELLELFSGRAYPCITNKQK